MKNILILSVILSALLISCSKTTPVQIKYQASGAVSTFRINFTDGDGNLQTAIISPQSAQDVWQLDFKGEQGDIVYLSGKYSDSHSALKLMILINGKVYKQASNDGDTIKYLTVSGVVPFE
jgi:hypothetical protein